MGSMAKGVIKDLKPEFALIRARLELNKQVKELGNDHPDTLDARTIMACILGGSSEEDDAFEQYMTLRANDERARLREGSLFSRSSIFSRPSIVNWLLPEGYVHPFPDAEIRVPLKPYLVPPLLDAKYYGRPAVIHQAMQLHQAVLHEREKQLGSDDSATLLSRSYVASCMGNLGNYTEALKQHTELLKDRARVLGEVSISTFLTRSNIAFFLAMSGKYDEALECNKVLLSNQLNAFDANHIEIWKTRRRIAYHFFLAGDNEKGLDAFRELFIDLKAISHAGLQDSHVLAACDDLMWAIMHSRLYDEAIGELRDLLAEIKSARGEEDLGTLRQRRKLALYMAKYLSTVGRQQAAYDEFQSLLIDQRVVLGDDHVDTLKTRLYIALLHFTEHRTRIEYVDSLSAMDSLSLLLADQKKFLAADHPDILTTRCIMVIRNGSSYNREKAYPLLADIERIWGVCTLDRINIRNSIIGGDWNYEYASPDHIDHILEEAQKLLADICEYFGPDNSKTISTRDRLYRLPCAKPYLVDFYNRLLKANSRL